MYEPLNVSDRMLDQVARRFHYLGEPFRLRILKLLSTGGKNVGELVEALQGNQPNVSKHLQLLYDAGLVSRRKEGTSNLYTICDPIVFQLCDLVCQSVAAKSREDIKEFQMLRKASLHRSSAGKKRRIGRHAP